jgi:hypothetical protein
LFLGEVLYGFLRTTGSFFWNFFVFYNRMQAQETPLALRSRNTSTLKRVASGDSGGGDGDNERLLLGHNISVNSEDRENLGCGVDEEQAYVQRNPNGNKARQLWQKVKKKYELLEYHLVPEYLQDNEFVLRHYRADWPIWDSLLSIFSLHNETVNIWTSAFLPSPLPPKCCAAVFLPFCVFFLCPLDVSFILCMLMCAHVVLKKH